MMNDEFGGLGNERLFMKIHKLENKLSIYCLKDYSCSNCFFNIIKRFNQEQNMLKQKEIIAIAAAYVEIVTKEEGAIFLDYKFFEKGIIFNYQSKDFVNSGKNGWFGGYSGFIVDNKKGLIYQDFRGPMEMNDEKLKNRFLANKIPAVSLSGIKAKFNMNT